MSHKKRSWRRSRPGAFDDVYEKYEKSVSEVHNDDMLAEIRRRVTDPDFVPDIPLPPHLEMRILDDVLSHKAKLEHKLVKQHMELEWLREQIVKVAAELKAKVPRKRRMLNSKAAVEEN